MRCVLEGMEVPPGSLVVGLPAKVIRPVDDAAATHVEHGWRHYVDQARRHREGKFPIEPTTGNGEGSAPRPA